VKRALSSNFYAKARRFWDYFEGRGDEGHGRLFGTMLKIEVARTLGLGKAESRERAGYCFCIAQKSVNRGILKQ
jgi:hypothetical protein